MPRKLSMSVCALLSGTAAAADFDVSVEVPQLNVAEYHKPYVAVWIERPDQSVAAHLDVWYDTKLKDHEGTKWLKDMRLWWRRIGREMTFPADAVSGPTRAPGTHSLGSTRAKAALQKLAPGNYQLMVEAAREVGGRELVKIPFTWPAKDAQLLKAQGNEELGLVTLKLQP